MDASLIPKAALNQHIAVLGKTGSGKTYAAKGIVEGLLRAHRQTCIIDPTGAWWGLRLAADGKGKGLDVVLLGGEHADIPLAERSGAAVARLVTEQGASAVIDTSGLTVGEYTRWFIDFAGTLYTTTRNPLHLVIDEAHYFMPQGRVPDPDAGRMLHAGNRLMSGGRSRGIRGMLITQRPQKLHKDSLTCADTLIAMRVIAPHDRAAVKEWVDGVGNPTDGKKVLDSLAQLQRGEGWVWYPEGGHLERVTFPAITTYDSSAAPKHGAKSAPKVAEIDLGEVRKALADAVKEAEANDPKLLRKRIAELEKATRGRPTDTKTVEVVKTVEVPVLNNGLLDRTEKIIDRLTTETGKVQAELAELHRLIAPAFAAKTAPRPVASRPQMTAARTAPAPRQSRTEPGNSESLTLGKCERAILQVLSQYPEGCNSGKLTLLSGYRYSGGFKNSLATLRVQGLIDGPNTGNMRITDDGLALGPFDPLPTGADLARYWLNHSSFGKCEREILGVLIENRRAMTSEELCAATGYQYSGGFKNSLSVLRTAGVIQGRNTGPMSANEELF